MSSDQLSASDLNGVDLVVMGTPTHNMNLSKAVKPVFETLPKRILKGVPIAVFDTSYKMSWWLNHFTAAKRLAQIPRKLGGVRIIPPETFLVAEREGPLYEGEINERRRGRTPFSTGIRSFPPLDGQQTVSTIHVIKKALSRIHWEYIFT